MFCCCLSRKLHGTNLGYLEISFAKIPKKEHQPNVTGKSQQSRDKNITKKKAPCGPRAQLKDACCLAPCSLPVLSHSPHGKPTENLCVVLFFILPFFSPYSVLFSAGLFVAFIFPVLFGSRRLILSALLTQGCRLFVISLGQFFPRFYIRSATLLHSVVGF